MENKDKLIKEARRLRNEGLSWSEISEKINQSESRVRSWVSDIKLTKGQISSAIRRRVGRACTERYRKIVVKKEQLKHCLENHGISGTKNRLNITEGAIRYW
ncbi:MAG: hypothetical protein ACR2PH_00060, partial [Desulfobulbia bacterium]